MTDRWAPVALVLVSHSRALAEGTVEVAAQMAPGVRLVAAGGTDDGRLGTSFDRVDTAVRDATSDGRSAVVVADLGSAVLTSEAVVEMLDEHLAARVRIADAPFVEGAVAAAVTAHGKADLAAVLASAHAAAATFRPAPGGPDVPSARPAAAIESLGAVPVAAPPSVPATAPTVAPDGSVQASAALRNPLGLHARPAALIVRMLAHYDARVQVNGVNAASVLELMKLGATRDDVLTITAQGPQASEAVERLVADVEAGFGEV
ncbi:dihydroxyacetone kinase, phosphotransfer subunit [Cellulomonas flavigena DSM 20109]|uniref:Phosphocarrier protein HPr n=1 Tax=Cellulomonas flavigena (strain ATCC 482 / DSM 20109 / BCRC 11376 / JCM 18109 / NBRC 3775 / NCIMB 8073 / NRS 134) TaxID=446466 RepID=D5UD20_CELFN|nr:dihydroxyacetone kinase phosphoryl donor subunit DhaM [Cellulomonas flavigena]ADG74357.1 dihydroxyacetone kinase, phosphotransfer subunit [Cellulomonas flavigena DSM 20109]